MKSFKKLGCSFLALTMTLSSVNGTVFAKTFEQPTEEWITLSNGINVKFISLYNGDSDTGIIAADANKPCSVAENVNAIFDGNTSTGVILRDATNNWDGYVIKGDYVGVKFEKPIEFDGATFTFDSSNNGDSYDNVSIEYQVEGSEEWVTAKTINGEKIVLAEYSGETISNVVAVRAVNGESSRATRRWVRINEIQIAGTVLEEGVANYYKVNEAVARYEALNAKDYKTLKPVADIIATIDYNLTAADQATIDGYATAINNAIDALEKIRFEQSNSKIEIAEVGNEQAQEPLSNIFDGDPTTLWHTNWQGSDRSTHHFTLNVEEQIYDEIKLLPRPQNGGDGDQNGVITKLNVYAKLGDSEWVKVVNEKTLNADGWQSVEFEVFMKADSLKVEVLEANSANAKLFASLAELKLFYATAADYTEFNAHKAKAEQYSASGLYTEETLSAYVNKVNEVELSLPAYKQAELDAAVDVLDVLETQLEKMTADYSALDKAIADAEALNAEAYEDFTAVEEALAAAKAIEKDLGVDAQGTIDAATKTLEDAIKALVRKPVFIEIPTEQMNVSAGNEHQGHDKEGPAEFAIDGKTDTMWHTDWTDSPRADHWFMVEFDDLKEINGMKFLQRTGEWPNGQITKYNLLGRVSEDAEWEVIIENGTLTTSNEWQTVTFDPIEVKYVKLVSLESTSDKAAQFSAIAEIRFTETGKEVEALADYTEVNKALSEIEKLNPEHYTNYEVVEQALAEVEKGLRISQQAEVDAMAVALNAAIGQLNVKPADYSKVDAALASMPADISMYTPETKAALIAAVTSVVEGLDITKQAEVDAMAKAIEDAVAGLKLVEADYSKVDEALAKVPSDKDIYEDFSAVDAAVESVVRGLPKAQQATVDAYAKAIEESIAALVLKAADYTAVEEAIASAEALVKDNYKDFAGVKAAIEAVVEGLDITKQAEVDAYAKAIEDAIEALELKEADYSEVYEIIEMVHTLDKELYENFEVVEEAIKAVVEGLDITKQDEVDAMADAINAAVAALKVKEDTEVDPTPDPKPEPNPEPTPDPEPEPDEEDKPVKPEKPEVPGEEEGEDNNVNTSDETSLFAFVSMMIMSVFAFFTSRKKKEY